MFLANRFEKLRFIIQEMELALFLARRLPQDHVSRNVARHVVIRAYDFIAHSRQLKKPLSALGFRVTEYHDRKESFFEDFEKYFLKTRHRLAAHVQDLDFTDRMDLWNGLEVQKLDFFVEAAKDIYIKVLGSLGIAEYVPYTPLPDQENPALITLLNTWLATHNPEVFPEMDTDLLAMTRPTGVALMNFAPVHTRAGQLVMIRRWLEEQAALLHQLRAFPSCERILRALLLTDVVSYADLLITRSDAGEQQAMDGLDKLLVQAALKEDTSAIPQFLAHYRYRETLDPLREVRDQVGGHLDIDEDHALAAILARLDGLSLSDLFDFFNLMLAVFAKVCRSVSFLRLYCHRRGRLHGTSAGLNEAYKPFDESRPAPVVASRRRLEWSIEEAQSALAQWLEGGEQSESGREYFSHMFAFSEVVERLEEEEHIGQHSRRYHSHDFTVAHRFIVERLLAEKTAEHARRILELLMSCRGGSPYPLSQVVVRYHAGRDALPSRYLFHALGKIVSLPDTRAQELLRRGALSPSWDTRYAAIFALFRIFTREEGVARANKQSTRRSYEQEVGLLLEPLSEAHRLMLRLSFASHLSIGEGHSFHARFTAEHEAFHQSIQRSTTRLLRRSRHARIHDTLKMYLEGHNYAAVSLLVGDGLNAAGKAGVAKAFYQLPFEGSDGSAAAAFRALRLKRYEEALAHMNLAVRREPAEPSLLLLQVELLMETPGLLQNAKQFLDKIRQHYVLTGAAAEKCSRLAQALAAVQL
jgi:hypothetical protein